LREPWVYKSCEQQDIGKQRLMVETRFLVFSGKSEMCISDERGCDYD
jgi:hypothetical protein